MVDDLFTWEILQVQIYNQCSGRNILVHIVKGNYLNIFVRGEITRDTTKQYCYFQIIHRCNYDRFFSLNEV